MPSANSRWARNRFLPRLRLHAKLVPYRFEMFTAGLLQAMRYPRRGDPRQRRRRRRHRLPGSAGLGAADHQGPVQADAQHDRRARRAVAHWRLWLLAAQRSGCSSPRHLHERRDLLGPQSTRPALGERPSAGRHDLRSLRAARPGVASTAPPSSAPTCWITTLTQAEDLPAHDRLLTVGATGWSRRDHSPAAICTARTRESRPVV